MINRTRFIKDILWILVFLGLTAAVLRLWFGLGATTNLTDAVPWGLWKVLNMIAGVALSTCGFTIGFLVYVLKLEKFKPLVKPAILIAFLGYGSSCFALLFDIGLPDRFWHPLFMWNEHSFLFEVFWCVMLYFSVTFIELIPNILEKYKLKRLVHILHKVAAVVVFIGIILSCLHHSSLGSLFLVTPYRLHPLWYSSWLPAYFFISAAGSGIMFLIMVKLFYARFYDPPSIFAEKNNGRAAGICLRDDSAAEKAKSAYGKDIPMLSSLSCIAASLLTIYLLLKVIDLFRLNLINVLFAGTWESWLYVIELMFTSALPAALVIFRKSRKSPYGLGAASFLSAAGLVLNRMDVGIFGYFRDAATIYFPSFEEWVLSIGVVAAATLVFLFISENFSIFDDKWKQYKIDKGIFKAAFDSISRVWQTVLQSSLNRISLIGVFVLPLAFVLMYPPYKGDTKSDIKPATGMDITRSVLFIDGDKNGMSTEFPHLKHQETLGKQHSCIKCHHISLPNDRSTPCSRCHRSMFQKTSIFDHEKHIAEVTKKERLKGLHPQNKSCTICHLYGSPKTAGTAKGCMECHKEDMKVEENSVLPEHFIYAVSYLKAMHTKCINCHKKKKDIKNKPDLDKCWNCHKSYYNKSVDRELITSSAKDL